MSQSLDPQELECCLNTFGTTEFACMRRQTKACLPCHAKGLRKVRRVTFPFVSGQAEARDQRMRVSDDLLRHTFNRGRTKVANPDGDHAPFDPRFSLCALEPER